MAYNIADLFEHAVDVVPDRIGIIVDGRGPQLRPARSRREPVAANLAAAGVDPGDHVGIYGPNSLEWMETMLGTFKVRAVPINVNYRYVTEELDLPLRQRRPGGAGVRRRVRRAGHARSGARVRSCTIWSTSAPRTSTPRPSGRSTTTTPSPPSQPARVARDRSPDDLYVLYTGGTTGFPKGVMWRQEDVFYALGGGIDALTNEPVHVRVRSGRARPSRARRHRQLRTRTAHARRRPVERAAVPRSKGAPP